MPRKRRRPADPGNHRAGNHERPEQVGEATVKPAAICAECKRVFFLNRNMTMRLHYDLNRPGRQHCKGSGDQYELVNPKKPPSESAKHE